MVFSTHLFIFYFLPTVVLLYYALPLRFRALLLALLSYCFYGWANPKWIILMLISTVLDYTTGLVITRLSGAPRSGRDMPLLEKGGRRSVGQKAALWASVVGNLTLLGFFKYFDFAAENVQQMAEVMGLGSGGIKFLHIALPVGISFYTFQTMSYTIDIYRGDARALRNPVDFACYVAMFPQLIAGPIVRYSDVAQQLVSRTHSYEKFARGVAFFALGMAKKILIANPMGYVADTAFGSASLHWYDAWYGVVAYAFQIYFDFSGYSDMAIGLGLMFGFVFIKNFDAPYRADSITDFWRRWHISLSSWLRDYLYVPLGGNRRGESRTYINLIIVMLLGGLWHGASWTFIIWGAIHGGMLALERLGGKDAPYRRLPRMVRVAVTFLIVCLAWVFFKSPTLPAAVHYLAMLFGAAAVAPGAEVAAAQMYTPYHVIMFLIAVLVVWKMPQTWGYTADLSLRRATVCMGLLAVSILVMWTQTENPFLYFQF